MDDFDDATYLEACLRLIEEQLGWGNARDWHHEVFIELSEKIQQKTQILISPTTLKRVWGRIEYKNSPSISTLNTLAQFAGFQNWRAFKSENLVPEQPWIHRKIVPNLGLIIVSASVMTIIFLSLYSLVSSSEAPSPGYTDVAFSSQPMSEGLPNSVLFEFDLEKVHSKDIMIQQYWDETKTIKIHPDQSQATGQYYYPGYFRAKLLIDRQIVKEHDLFIKTKDWLGTIDYDPIPKYISPQDLLRDKLAFSNEVISEIENNEQTVFSSFHFVNELESISGDQFTLETTIQHTFNDRWAVCQKTSIVILGTKSAFIIPFSIPGCVSDIGVMISERYLSGKENDLSIFGTDLSSPKSIKVLSEGRSIQVFIDDLSIFSRSYEQSIGDIVGIRFRFLGVGEVHGLRLYDDSGRFAFKDNFEPILKFDRGSE